MKKYKILAITSLLISIIFITSNLNPYYKLINKQDSHEKGLKVYILDVGQADAFLLELNKKFILIDAGKNSDEIKIVEYLKSLDVNNLNYVFATHGHSDHIGGMDNVIYNFPIGWFYMTDDMVETKTYKDFIDALNNKNVPIVNPTEDVSIKMDDLQMEIFPPKKKSKNINNNSLVIKINYGNFDMLFTGDMEKEEENDLMERENNLDVDVLKVAHHGSKTSSTEEFLQKTKSEYAIISVGKNNKYGHPNEEVIDRLKGNKTEIYRTDINGHILIKSDGNEIKILSQK